MPRERHGALSRAVSRDPGREPGRGSSRGAAAPCNIGIAALFRDSDSRTLISCNNSHKIIDCLYFRAIMAPEEGSGVRRPPCFPHRREKTPEERTGEVRPASRARNQAHEPRRRDTRARAGAGARRIRANQGPAAWPAGRREERNEDGSKGQAHAEDEGPEKPDGIPETHARTGLIPTVVDRNLWRRRLSSCLRSFLSPRPPSRGPVRPCGGPGRSRLFSLAAPAGNAVAGPRLGGRGDS